MIIYISVMIILLILYTIFFYIKSKICINRIKRERNKEYDISHFNKKIIIAIPVLREQKCIESTIDYFKQIFIDIPIVIITTQKEVKENVKNEKLTYDIVKNKILTKYDNVYLIDYPYNTGYMSDQLNYMIENIELILGERIDLANTYLALYNADSRPSKKTLEDIKLKIKEENKVIQQYSYCMYNYDNLSNILKGFSIYQSNFEIKTGFINSYLNSKFLYTHVVGHGLIINMKILRELGNFNTDFWCEDIYLGLQLKFNNIKIVPLLSLENMETPSTFCSLIKQNSVWFKTTRQFYKIYKDIIGKGKVLNKLNGFIGCFNEFRCAINWVFFPIVLLIAIIGVLIINNPILLLSIIISYLFYVCINTIMTIKIINILGDEKYKVSIKMILNTAIATAISNIGPIYSLLFNKKEKYKTER